MSYTPEIAELKKIREEARMERRKTKKKAEEQKYSKETRPESPTFGLYYTEDEDVNMNEYSKNHKEQSLHSAPIDLMSDDSELDSDSDFGSNANQECYSLSF